MRRFCMFTGLLLVIAAVGCGGDTPPFDTGNDLGVPDVQTDDGAPDVTDNGQPDEGPVDTGRTDVVDVVEDTGPMPCVKNSDCVDAPLSPGECQKKVCDLDTNFCVLGWDSDCCMAATWFFDDFEGGIGSWTLVDPKPNDRVSWTASQKRRAFGVQSAYFGNTTCYTYYSGAMNGDCDPVDINQADSASVRASITSPYFELPAISAATSTFVVSAYLWVESEPMIPELPADVQLDQFRVMVVTKTGDVESVDNVVASTAEVIDKNTKGQFIFVSAVITQYVGKEIAIRLLFDSIDGTNNLYEGVFVDDVKVFSLCDPQCDSGTECESDDVECTDDSCQAFLNRTNGKGSCSFPLLPTCVEPQCTEATVATKCPSDDPCVVASCVEGACVYEDLPDDQCCRTRDALTAGFEAGSLDGFEVWSYLGEEQVKWRASSFRSSDGSWALYYGDPVARTYATGTDFNFGEATSPEIELPVGDYAFLTFDLWLSTEWDGTEASKYYNPGEFDYLSVNVVEYKGQPTETVTEVWSAHSIQSTTGGNFIPVGVDLSPWAGKVVRVMFSFETGSGDLNDFEGPYIDNINVVSDNCTQRNCQSEADCGIDGICRAGGCIDNLCSVSIVGATGCCALTQDCDDGDSCSADGCVNNVCLHEPIEKPGCCYEDVRADYVFDIFGDLDGFAVVSNSVPGTGGADVRWVLSELRAHSGTRSMYFGNVENGSFDNGGIARGTATSPEFTVPATGDYKLSFYVYLDVQTDSAKDIFKVDVMDGLTPTTVFSKSAVPSAVYRNWFQVSDIDLGAFSGKKVKLRFSFDSVDNLLNTSEGVFVDDIRVQRDCP